MRDLLAINLVTATFDRYNSTERQALYERWEEADRLYSGFKEADVWEGSNVERATFPYRVVFDQVEAAVPAIREALFGQSEWFDIVPLPGGDMTSAKQLKARLKFVLSQQAQGYGPTAKSEIMLGVRDAVLYGQGILGIEFNPAIKNPEVCKIDPRDMFMDLANTTPWVDKCRSVIRVSKKTVEELEKWRGAPQVKLPSKRVLFELAKNPNYSPADEAKDESAAIAGAYTRQSDSSVPMPSHGLVQVLSYYDNERMIVVLGRNYTIYNEKNPYGCIPFVVIPAYDVPNKFMGYGYGDILWEIQRITESLMNGRLDEITMQLNPPRAMSSKGMMTASQEAFRPGAVYKSNEPKDAVINLFQGGFSTNIWNEVEFYRTAGELRTGLNGLAQGSARPGNVNRTAGGVSSQLQASALRLSNIVYNVETFGIVPLLAKVVKFLQVHESPGEFAQGQGETGYEYVETSSYYRPVSFQVRAASNMLSQERLQQVLPIILQNLVNGPLVQALAANGQTVDATVLMEMIQDASGTKDSYQLIRPMNEQETAARQAPPPQVQAMMAKEQSATQRALQLGQMDSQTKLQVESMKHQPNPMEMQIEAQKAEIEMAMKQKELEFKEKELQMKEREGQMKLQMKNMEMEQKAQQAQLDQFLGQAKAQSDLQITAQKGQLQQQQLGLQAERDQKSHEFEMQSMEEQSALQKRLGQDKTAISGDKVSASKMRLESTKPKQGSARAARPKKEE
jgi:hypothetical protein